MTTFFNISIHFFQAQDPRKRFQADFFVTDDQYLKNNDLEYLQHKRVGTDGSEPFWANRGKKDPTYLQEPFYVDEPYWILVRRNQAFDDDPFFVSRGKKEAFPFNMRMKFLNDYTTDDDPSKPFYAARGKKEYEEKIKS